MGEDGGPAAGGPRPSFAFPRILVAGGSGFIGADLVRLILRRFPEARVTVLDRLDNPRRILRLQDLMGSDRLRVLRGDVTNRDTVRPLCRHVDAVVNLASTTPGPGVGTEEHARTNTVGAGILMEAAQEARVDRFLHVSTSEVYGPAGDAESRRTESAPLDPRGPFPASKAAADQMVLTQARAHGYGAFVARLCNVYGPRDRPAGFVARVVDAATRGGRIELYGTGMTRREWLHVHDVSRALLAALTRGGAGRAYNLGSGTPVPDQVVVGLALGLTGGSRDQVVFHPDRRGESRTFPMAGVRAATELGWEPERGLIQGLRETVGWFRNHPGWLSNLGRDGADPEMEEPHAASSTTSQGARRSAEGFAGLARTLMGV